MAKRWIALFLAAGLALMLPGCVGAERPLTITATFYPLYVAAINLVRGVEGTRVQCMAPPQSGCLHDYQLTAADRRALFDSDVVILNGAGFEGFLTALLQGLDLAAIDASKGMALLPDREGEGMNPHVWVSVAGMAQQVQTIAAGLAQADPGHAEQYAQNCAEYVARLEALDWEMAGALAPYSGEAIVTFHEAFDYFAEAFGLRVAAVIATDHANAPSGRELARVAKVIQEENVRALFAEPQYENVSVEILSRETGVPVYVLDPAVQGTADPQGYDAYIEIMRKNLDTLVEALS